MKNLFSKFAVLTLAAGLFSASAAAAPITLNMAWSGAPAGNSASASGTMVVDSDLLRADNLYWTDMLTDLRMTVSDGGVYDQYDFIFFAVEGMGTLDFSRQLIGQLLPNGCSFGSARGACGGGLGGDFNLIAFDASVPTGVGNFQMQLASGEVLTLTSLAPADVPEPGSLALLGLSIAGVAAARRRQAATQ